MVSFCGLKCPTGALSDSSTSKYRRRFWIVLSTVALVISTLTLAYCEELAAFLVGLIGVDEANWTEKRQEKVSGANHPYPPISH